MWIIWPLYSRNVIHGGHGFGEIEGKVIDGDQHIFHCLVPIDLFPFYVHCELHVGLSAVRDQVVLAQARELVHITVKRLEVPIAPCTANAANMVAN